MIERPLSRRKLLKGTAGAALGAAVATPAATTAAPGYGTFLRRLSSQEANTITVWHFGGTVPYLAWMEAEIPNFEAASGLTVEYTERDWAKQREDLLAALTVGEVPDVVRTHNKYVAEFGDTGDLKALEDFEDFPQVAETFLPSFLANTEHNGQHYGLPEVALPFILAVNQPMLDAAEVPVPTNWDEFKAAALALTKPDEGVYGYTIPGGVNLDTAYRFAPWLYKAGGRFLSDDWSEATFNGPAGVAALEMLLELQAQGAIPPGNAAYAFAESADVWAAQKAAMSTEGPWWQGHISGEQYKLDLSILTIAPVPAQPQPVGGNLPGTLLDLTMVAIMANGKNVEGGWEFLKYFRSPEIDALKVDPLVTDGLPTTKQPYEDPSIAWTYLGKETYLKELESVVTWPNHPNITEIQLKVAEALNAAFSGAASAQEALDAAAEDVNDILEG